MSYKTEVLALEPFGYWRMDATSGTIETDIGSGKNNGVYQNDFTLEGTGIPGDTLPGEFAAKFNPTLATGLFFAESTTTVSGTWSLEFWIKPVTTSGWLTGNATVFSAQLLFKVGGAVELNIGNGTTFPILGGSSAPTVVNPEEWTHVVLVAQPTGVKLYLNTVEAFKSTTAATYLLWGSGKALQFASKAGVNLGLKSLYDEIAVYTKVLTPEQIKAHYLAGEPNAVPWVTLPIAASGVETAAGEAAHADLAMRIPLKLPIPAAAYRFRARNFSAAHQTAGSGPMTMNAYIGKPDATERWKGKLAAAPTKVVTAAEIPTASDLITPWISSPTFAAGTKWAASFGLTNAEVSFPYDNGGGLYWQGATSAAQAAEEKAPSTTGPALLTIMDVRLEVQWAGRYGIAIGDSITDSGPGTDGGPFPYETWPGVLGLNLGYPVADMGVQGSTAANWIITTNELWTRMSSIAAGHTPDFAVVSLGFNDIVAGELLATIEGNIETIMNYLKTTLKIPRVYLGTVTPGQSGTEAAEQFMSNGQNVVREELNTWMRGKPNGAVGVFDFDKKLRTPGTHFMNPAYGTITTLIPHPNRTGYAAMASLATEQLGGGEEVVPIGGRNHRHYIRVGASA